MQFMLGRPPGPACLGLSDFGSSSSGFCLFAQWVVRVQAVRADGRRAVRAVLLAALAAPSALVAADARGRRPVGRAMTATVRPPNGRLALAHAGTVVPRQQTV